MSNFTKTEWQFCSDGLNFESVSVYNGRTPVVSNLMNVNETVDAQISLPNPLYQVLAQRAQQHGHSVSNEVVTLLSSLLSQQTDDLDKEFSDWEVASDEDWLAMEASLMAEDCG